MGCKTIGKFYYDSTVAADIAANANFQFSGSKTSGSVRLSADNQSIQVLAPGVYEVEVNVTGVGTAATSNMDVQLRANGAAVPGARGAESFTAVGDIRSTAFSTVLTVNPAVFGNVATLTIANLGTAASYTVANVVVKKIA